MFNARNSSNTNTVISVTTTEHVVIPPRSKDPDAPLSQGPLIDQISGKRFWGLYLANGRPTTPDYISEEILAGRCRLDDLEKAERDLELFYRVASERHAHSESDTYWRPIAMQHKRNAIEALARFDERYPEGPVIERLMSAREVAEVLGIGEKTVIRQSGKSIPAHVMVGSQYRWKASAIQAFINQGAR